MDCPWQSYNSTLLEMYLNECIVLLQHGYCAMGICHHDVGDHSLIPYCSYNIRHIVSHLQQMTNHFIQ